MTDRDRIYINGKWVMPRGKETIQVWDSTDGSVMGTIPSCSAADVDDAVEAARAAFDSWARTDVQERARYLTLIAEGLVRRMDEIAAVISRETGMAKGLARKIQVGLPVSSFNEAAAVARKFGFSRQMGSSLVVREPIGVVGCITPWNYPLHQISAKVAFAMAAGCSVVLKPSEVAPLDAFMLTEIIAEAGLPAGVFNLVTGTGPIVGEAIATHPGVDMVSFTGSTRAGRRVSQLAAETIKKVSLELGGKSANVLCGDLDEAAFAKAVAAGVSKAFLNSGQTCSALTRMLVPRSRLGEAEKHAVAAAGRMKVGDPFDQTAHLGPLASAEQCVRVNGFIQRGIDEGARLLLGGVGVPEGVSGGYYVKPTVFSDVTSSMTIAQEEIFGPVLSILPYDDEEEAIRIANDTIYGLAGAVWAANKDKAMSIARRMRAGQVEVNGGAFNLNAPFGGYKQSGVGRELGDYGFEEFLEVKSLQL